MIQPPQVLRGRTEQGGTLAIHFMGTCSFALLLGNPCTLTIPQYRLNKTKQHTREFSKALTPSPALDSLVSVLDDIDWTASPAHNWAKHSCFPPSPARCECPRKDFPCPYTRFGLLHQKLSSSLPQALCARILFFRFVNIYFSLHFLRTKLIFWQGLRAGQLGAEPQHQVLTDKGPRLFPPASSPWIPCSE